MDKEKLAEHVKRAVDSAPPLSEEQRTRIARILMSAQPHFEVSKPKRIEIKR